MHRQLGGVRNTRGESATVVVGVPSRELSPDSAGGDQAGYAQTDKNGRQLCS